MKNTKGQMHVLEVLLVATLFTSTVNVAVNVLPTSDANNVDEYELYFSGLEILEVLDEWVPSDSSIAETHHDSTLSWWLATENFVSIKQYLDAGLSSSISYRLEGTHGSESETIVDRIVPGGSVSQTFRIVWAGDELWELNLQLWYGYREG
ncbi:MAG: hypothetical protein CMB06_03220 [Euryarchaeota archaeon]|nr:hypothetical protein [Euryarchaeota archaeon]|tara:strand:+ start:1871 stop:2323 length:453 start_codon:yes stop_codon:yes gene_type:complete